MTKLEDMTVPELEEFIRVREIEARELYVRHLACKEEIRAARIEHAGIKWSVRVGSVVLFRGDEFLVRLVDPRPWSDRPPWLVGSPKKKDGTWSKARRSLYSDWELVK